MKSDQSQPAQHGRFRPSLTRGLVRRHLHTIRALQERSFPSVAKDVYRQPKGSLSTWSSPARTVFYCRLGASFIWILAEVLSLELAQALPFNRGLAAGFQIGQSDPKESFVAGRTKSRPWNLGTTSLPPAIAEDNPHSAHNGNGGKSGEANLRPRSRNPGIPRDGQKSVTPTPPLTPRGYTRAIRSPRPPAE